MNFEPDPTEDGWRWRGPVEDSQVKLEFPALLRADAVDVVQRFIEVLGI
jgi:hypothetical protein